MYTGQDDIALVQNMRDPARAHAAFGVFYDRYASKVYTYCRRVLGGNSLELDDIVQTVFLRFYEAAISSTITQPAGYLFRIARNACYRQHSRRTMDIIDADTIADHVVDYSTTELLRLIEAAQASLPDDLQEVFVMREQLGLSYQDIATTLSIGVGAARMRAHRARGMIREILAPYLQELDTILGSDHAPE